MIRSILFLLFLMPCVNLFSQISKGFNYQAAIRNVDGVPISGKDLKIRISILNESSTGNVLYREEHLAKSSKVGLVTLIIGDGQNKFGSLETIQWGVSPKYVKVEYAEDGSNTYFLTSTAQLQSVPYALFAETTKLTAGDGIGVNGNVITNIGDKDNDPKNEIQNLTINGNTLSISGANSVQIPSTFGGSNITVLTTNQILSLSDKPQGTMYLSSDNNAIYYYAGTNWYKIESTIQQSGGGLVVNGINDCLVAYYNFDNSDANDYNNIYNGIVNGVQFSTDVNSKINQGKSATFDGNDRITVPLNALKNLTQGTISFWIKSSAEGSILFGDTKNTQAFQIRIYSNLGKKLLWYNVGFTFGFDMTPYLNNSWNHIAVTISSSEMKLYANGQLLETNTNNQGMTGTSFGDGMLMGQRESFPAWNFTGKLDNLRIHCKALTENEVKQIFNAGQ